MIKKSRNYILKQYPIEYEEFKQEERLKIYHDKIKICCILANL